MNCLIIDDEPLARKGLRQFAEKIEHLEVLGELKNAREALEFLASHPVDMLFLDIKMPGISGLEMLDQLAYRPAVVLTTAFPDYAVRGFDLEVQDYLLKPFSFDRFKQSIRKVSEYLNQNSASPVDDSICLRADGSVYKIKVDEILYVQALQNYIRCVTTDKRYVSHMTLKSIEEKLPEDLFIRIHKSYIVNSNRIKRFVHNELTIANESLPISRFYRNNALSRLRNPEMAR